MHDLWWRLPGPTIFLSRLESDLKAGRNLLIALPRAEPPNLRTAVSSLIKSAGTWFWEVLDLSELKDRQSPVVILHRLFAPISDPKACLSPRSLAGAKEFSGTIVWIEGVSEETCTSWLSFLDSYSQAFLENDPFDRGLVCIVTRGIEIADTFSKNPALSVRKWSDVIDQIDTTLYASQILRSRAMPSLHRKLSIAIIAELALWDLELAARLAKENWRTLLNPEEILIEFSKERGWHEDLAQAEWASGLLNRFEGQDAVHSCFLALRGDKSIRNRIWKGQVRVLFPFIEECRLRLIQELNGYLKVPFHTDYGDILDIRELEIGHIFYQVKGYGISLNKRNLVKILWKMRTCLAHLEPVDEKLLSSPELLSLPA